VRLLQPATFDEMRLLEPGTYIIELSDNNNFLCTTPSDDLSQASAMDSEEKVCKRLHWLSHQRSGCSNLILLVLWINQSNRIHQFHFKVAYKKAEGGRFTLYFTNSGNGESYIVASTVGGGRLEKTDLPAASTEWILIPLEQHNDGGTAYQWAASDSPINFQHQKQ